MQNAVAVLATQLLLKASASSGVFATAEQIKKFYVLKLFLQVNEPTLESVLRLT